MLIVGAVLLLASILAWRNGGEMLRGMLIPLGVLMLIATGYGGFMQVNRPAHATALAERYQRDPELSRTAEISRLQNDCANYRKMNMIWSTIFLTAIALIFLAGSGTWKGVALGLIVLSSVGFVVDNFLFHRAAVYLEAIA